jgi:hypothetical protein
MPYDEDEEPRALLLPLPLPLALLRLRAGEAVRCGVCGRDDGLDDGNDDDGVPRPFEDERLEASGMAFDDEEDEDETEAEAGRGLPALEGREELPAVAATDFSPRRLPLWVVAGAFDADTGRDADDERG